MTSLADQLKTAKLKKVTEPIKDFSSPKTAGYISQEEITQYQNCVLDVNAEKWMHLLRNETFPTDYCPMEVEEAKLFVEVYEELYANADSQKICEIDWKKHLSPEKEVIVDSLTKRLDTKMAPFVQTDGFAFVKTSSRSAKDAPMAKKRFKDLYQKYLQDLTEEDRGLENSQITCLLKAAFEGMKVRSAEDVIDMSMRSERIYQDMLLALAVEERFHENFVIRKFVEIDVDMEFRGFVFSGELQALSQYNYLIFSKRLFDMRDEIKEQIVKYFTDEVRHRLDDEAVPKEYIIDFAVCDGGKKLWVIELNPFAETTDGALFSWQHERPLLEGSEGFQFRIVERPKPGAKAMLPQSVKAILNN